jgi:hypothetical protein
MKLSVASLVTLALTAGVASAANAAPALRTYDYCAGSPLTMGLPFSAGGRVVDIAVVADGSGVPVGWVYAGSLGNRFIQANAHMSADDQSALKLNARSAVSNLHRRPASLPADLIVRRCRANEIARY